MTRFSVSRPTLALIFIATSLTLHTMPFASELKTQSWHFDSEAPDSLPSNFQIGTLFDGRPAGEWKVIETEKAKVPATSWRNCKGREQNMPIRLS
jgi:hypothetical protein